MKLWLVRITVDRSTVRLIGQEEQTIQINAETAVEAIESAVKAANLDDTQVVHRIEAECLL